MQGKIVKGIAGFYYVHVANKGVYECKAKGTFRKNSMKPLVGDEVELQIIDEKNKIGNVEKILPRKNKLIRPAVANVDQALVIFSITKPLPNLNLLDRFLIMMEQQNMDTIICFNKMDIATKEEWEALKNAYQECGYQVIFCSTKEDNGMDAIKHCLKGKTTTVAGPSGVGKSSMINCLQENVNMETGAISEKIDRGKHTTRHSELIAVDEDTYLMDTPGFSSLHLFDLEKEELVDYYKEFGPFQSECRFQGCSHTHEPDCMVKEALQEGKISKIRYDNYVALYKELKEKRKY